jgi:hypothetical protein
MVESENMVDRENTDRKEKTLAVRKICLARKRKAAFL